MQSVDTFGIHSQMRIKDRFIKIHDTKQPAMMILNLRSRHKKPIYEVRSLKYKGRGNQTAAEDVLGSGGVKNDYTTHTQQA